MFKNWYFWNTNPMNPIKSLPSYRWRSIISTRPLVKKILIKKWVWSLLSQCGMIHGYQLIPWGQQCVRHNYYPNFTINQLIDLVARMWNMDLIKKIIVSEDIPLIQSISIGITFSLDTLGWHCTKSKNIWSDHDIIRRKKSHFMATNYRFMRQMFGFYKLIHGH